MLGAAEACGTDDMAVSEFRHTAVTNSKNRVLGIDFHALENDNNNI